MTAAEFWAFARDHLSNTVAVAGVALLRWLVKRPTRGRVVGWVTVSVGVGGYLFGGLARWLVHPTDLSYRMYAAFGMVTASVSGYLIGRFVWHFYGREPENDEAGG